MAEEKKAEEVAEILCQRAKDQLMCNKGHMSCFFDIFSRDPSETKKYKVRLRSPFILPHWYAVEEDLSVFRHIKNPTEKVQLFAVNGVSYFLSRVLFLMLVGQKEFLNEYLSSWKISEDLRFPWDPIKIFVHVFQPKLPHDESVAFSSFVWDIGRVFDSLGYQSKEDCCHFKESEKDLFIKNLRIMDEHLTASFCKFLKILSFRDLAYLIELCEMSPQEPDAYYWFLKELLRWRTKRVTPVAVYPKALCKRFFAQGIQGDIT